MTFGSGEMPLLFWSATTDGNVDPVDGSVTVTCRRRRVVVVSSIGRHGGRLEDLLGSIAERRLTAEDGEDLLHVVAVEFGDQHGVALDRRGP